MKKLRSPDQAKLWLLYTLVIGVPALFGGSTVDPAIGGTLSGLARAVLVAALWVALTPVVLQLARRWPIRRARWTVPVALHLAAMAACVAATAFVVGAIAVVFGAASDASVIDRVIETSIAAVMPFYAAVIAVGTILDSRARAEAVEVELSEARRLTTEARLEALRAQLNPHFLFNALNTAVMAVRRADRDEALSVLLGLSALLRKVLAHGADVVRLGDELDFIAQYLAIESARFRDRLRTEVETDSAALDAAVPAMLLQPLVENAVHHGIARSSDAGTVTIRAALIDGRVAIEIEDDGPGFRDGWAEGIGLANVRRRLAAHFGGRSSFETMSTDRGARVRLSFPYAHMPGDAHVPDPDRR